MIVPFPKVGSKTLRILPPCGESTSCVSDSQYNTQPQYAAFRILFIKDIKRNRF